MKINWSTLGLKGLRRHLAKGRLFGFLNRESIEIESVKNITENPIVHDNYIFPILKVYSTFDEAKEFYDKFGGVSLFTDEERPGIADIAKGRRELVVGEPGVGKSILLYKIQEQLERDGCITSLISLRQSNSVNRISEFVQIKTDRPRALLLDALDEVRSNLLPEILQKIEEVSADHPGVQVFLSSRWVFINRYSKSFPGYRFVAISPFTEGQVREYLKAAKHPDNDIDILLDRILPFNHRMLVIQVPRYLSYLENFLKKEGIKAATEVSRNELFEYFIYSKLDLEDVRLNVDKKAIIKRVLEKLALTMEIYQTNVLSKDELMTFFDEIKSDLKLIALSQIKIEVFFEKSLLKNNIDEVEFDNTEFQEYLAAKEISRLPDPNRIAADFSVDQNVNEIYPSWFNALTFLVDMQPDLLGQLIDFSGLRATQFKIVDEGFFTFLSRIDPNSISQSLKNQIFSLVLDYHNRTLQWLPMQLASALPSFFISTLEQSLKDKVEEAEKQEGTPHFVPLGNVIYVIAFLLKRKLIVDTKYWRNKLIKYTADSNDNGVLQRHSLFALSQLGDPSVIDSLPDFKGADELIVNELINTCIKLNPENQKSIRYFIESIRRNDFHGRYGIAELKNKSSIKYFLETYNKDEQFRKEFLDDTRIFNDRDKVLVENIATVLDDEVRDLCKTALAYSVGHHIVYDQEQSVFIVGLWKLLRRGDSGFVCDMVDRIKNSSEGKAALYFARHYFEEVIEPEDVGPYIKKMTSEGERDSAVSLLLAMKYSKRAVANDIYETGRFFLPEEYKEEENIKVGASDTYNDKKNENILKQFHSYLEPEKGKFEHAVFKFYNQNVDILAPLASDEEKKRLEILITGTIFKFVNPIEKDLIITEQREGSKSFRTDGSVFTFAQALVTAKHLSIDINNFRKNILGFIPFAYDSELKAIFDLVPDIKPGELDAVLDVYKAKKSDLWRHQPDSFVEAAERYYVTEAIPILKSFVKESAIDKYARERALVVANTLSSDPLFLKEIFTLYSDSASDDERNLAQIANGLLITLNGDVEAIRWRLAEIVQRAAEFTRTPGVHRVGRLEEEIEHGKSFAKPLMDLKYPGHEESYLKLLEDAIAIYGRGKGFHAYAVYLWEVVYAYFENLKEGRDYEPLRKLEKKIVEMKDQDGSNWLANRMVQLRRSYLGYLGRPRNVFEAIKKYNKAKAYDDKKILTSADLYRQLQDALDTEIRRLIEGEGLYALILGEKVFDAKKQQYEVLIQKTLKTQIENVMIKKGFNIELIREPQLYDEKRVDYFVRYGFAGPVVIEIKLTSNNDLKGKSIEESPSYVSMGRYMDGYGALYGILLVIDNDGAKNLSEIKEIFQTIPNVSVCLINCYKSAPSEGSA